MKLTARYIRKAARSSGRFKPICLLSFLRPAWQKGREESYHDPDSRYTKVRRKCLGSAQCHTYRTLDLDLAGNFVQLHITHIQNNVAALVTWK